MLITPHEADEGEGTEDEHDDLEGDAEITTVTPEPRVKSKFKNS